MKVLLVNDLAAPVGGAERSVLDLRAALRGAGHEVELFAADPAGLPVASQADHRCRGSLQPRGRVAMQTANPWAARRLRQVLEGFRPDVVHVRMFLTQLSPLILPVLRQVPTVYHVALYEAICPITTKLLPDGTPCDVPAGRVCRTYGCVTPQSWVAAMARLKMTRRWLPSVDAVVALSETVRRRLETDGIPVDRVIGNGIPRREVRTTLVEPPTIAFAGRLVRAKGPDVLLEAFATVRERHPSARLLIAGDGPDRAPLVRRVREIGLADAVDLPGHLDVDALERRLAGTWVQVVPGRWEEPFGRVVAEAMMRGTAVVASDLGGPAELIEDGLTGLLVPPGDPSALAGSLDSLLSDRDLTERLGRAGHAHAVDALSEERVVAEIEELYAELTTRRVGEATA